MVGGSVTNPSSHALVSRFSGLDSASRNRHLFFAGPCGCTLLHICIFVHRESRILPALCSCLCSCSPALPQHLKWRGSTSSSYRTPSVTGHNSHLESAPPQQPCVFDTGPVKKDCYISFLFLFYSAAVLSAPTARFGCRCSGLLYSSPALLGVAPRFGRAISGFLFD